MEPLGKIPVSISQFFSFPGANSGTRPDQGNLFHAQPRPYPLLLKLLCIPTQAIRSTYETSNLGAATPEEIATKLFDLENEWPRKGTLVVAVNPHKTWGKTWLPIDLVSAILN